MTSKQFLLEEYRKALKNGYYYYAWAILQNLHLKARCTKRGVEFSNLYVNEEGILFSN
ncbi:MAG: hypothetical protein ACM3S2_08840 [Ignavibacteriales bacterium]